MALNFTAVSAHDKTLGGIGTYWHMLPEAAQARKAIWEAVNPHTGKRRIDEAFPDAICETKRETDMFIRFKIGSTWQVVGSDNYDSLLGSPPIGVVFSEWSRANPASWGALRPILRENKGWALFITTPNGLNHCKKMLDAAKNEPSWFWEVSDARKTGVFTKEELDEELRGYISDYGEDDGRAYFEQEYLCSFISPMVGSYYGREIAAAENEGRICSVPYDPRVLVSTAWDIGYGDDTAIWCAQIVGKEVRIIDYFEDRGAGLDHYVAWLKSKPYAYHQHIFPHDGANGEFIAGSTIIKTARGLLGRNVIVLPRISIADRIQSGRALFPRAIFDEKKTERGLNALRAYQRKWNEERKAFSNQPLHNWASHGADAWTYLAMAIKPPRPLGEEPRRAAKAPSGEGAWMA